MRAAKGDGSLFPDATGGYRGYVTIDGRRKYFRGATKAEAAAKRKDLIGARDAGMRVHGKAYTVTEWMLHWVDTIAELKPYTEQTYRWTIDKVIGPELGRAKLDKLTPERIEKWLKELPHAPSSKRRFLGILRAGLAVAEDRGHLRRNPATQVKTPPLSRPNTTSFSIEDARAILAAADARPDRARWHLGIREGLRPGEVLGLAWTDIDWTTGKLTVRRQLSRVAGQGLILQSPKTDAGHRTWQLSAALLDILREHYRLHLEKITQAGPNWTGWEFEGQPISLMFSTATGSALDPRNDQREWRRLLDAAGVPHARRYQARHTAASLMLSSGGDVAVVARKLGHSDPSFTYKVYVHPINERDELLAETMDAVWGAPNLHPTAAESSDAERPTRRPN